MYNSHLLSRNRGAPQLVSGRTRRRITLPLQPEQHFLETCQIGRARPSTSNGLALRVLQLNGVTDTLPSGTLGERGRKFREELLLVLPISDS